MLPCRAAGWLELSGVEKKEEKLAPVDSGTENKLGGVRENEWLEEKIKAGFILSAAPPWIIMNGWRKKSRRDLLGPAPTPGPSLTDPVLRPTPPRPTANAPKPALPAVTPA
jgi:hypothetical protein